MLVSVSVSVFLYPTCIRCGSTGSWRMAVDSNLSGKMLELVEDRIMAYGADIKPTRQTRAFGFVVVGPWLQRTRTHRHWHDGLCPLAL